MKKLAFTFILGFVLTGSIYAQQAPPQTQPHSSPSNVEITPEDVKKFRAVEPKITKLQQKLGKEISKAENPVEARELQAKAQEKMVKVVMNEGLSVEKYNAIAQGATPGK